jgi:hypothetical protein
MSNSITDEQLQAIEAEWASSLDRVDVVGEGWTCGDAIDALAVMRIALRERDATITDLKCALIAAEAKAFKAEAEVAELRKPVAVEPEPKDVKEARDLDRIYRAAASNPMDSSLSVEAKYFLGVLIGVTSAHDALARQCAAYANAHEVLMGERAALRERERQLRECIEHSRQFLTPLRPGADAGSQRMIDDALDIIADLAASPAPVESEREPPYYVRSFWSPCRKYIVTACVPSPGSEICVVDDDGRQWEPTGPVEDMTALAQPQQKQESGNG